MRQLFIDYHRDYIVAIKTEDSVLKEFFVVAKDNIVDNIYIGRVENVRGHQCFVNFDENRKNGILDLKNRNYKSGDYIKCQVKRDEFEDKGAILTDEITLGGQYSVLAEGIRGYKFSHRLRKQDIEKLKKELPQTSDYGFIIRKQAFWVTPDVVISEINKLIDIFIELNRDYPQQIQCIHKKNLIQLLINETEAYGCDIITNSIEGFSPNLSCTLYEGLQPLQDFYNLRKQIDELFERKVQMKNGTELVIDETEAMTVIDVNAKGFFADISLINKLAAQEVVKQLRLRNISGMVMIDFISNKDNEVLTDYINELLSNDKERARAIGLNEYSIIAINRKKRYNTFKTLLYQRCDKCGKGTAEKKSFLCQKICEAILNLYVQTGFKSLLARINEEIYSDFIASADFYLNKLIKMTKIFVEKDTISESYSLLITDDKGLLNRANLIQEAK